MARVKDRQSEHEELVNGLSPNMQSFVGELNTIFPDLTFTSGRRDAKDKIGKNSEGSKHNTGDAVDFTQEKVFKYLYNTKDGLALLNKYNLGVLDETDPETMKKTEATGAHYHIGTDSKLASHVKDKYSKMSSGEINELPLNRTIPLDIMSADGNVTLNYVDVKEFQDEIEKQKQVEESVKGDPDKSAIEDAKIEEEEEPVEQKSNFIEYPSNKEEQVQSDENNDNGYDIGEIEIDDTPYELPDLPNMFDVSLPQAEEQG